MRRIVSQCYRLTRQVDRPSSFYIAQTSSAFCHRQFTPLTVRYASSSSNAKSSTDDHSANSDGNNSQRSEKEDQKQPHAPPPTGQGFFRNLVDGLNLELAKNKELDENKKRLQEEINKMRDSDELKQARAKFDIVSQETLDSTERLRQKANELHKKIHTAIEDIQKTEYGKRVTEVGGAAIKAAAEAADTVRKSAEALGDAPGVKQVAQSMKAVQAEINDITLGDARMYQRPDVLRMRSDYSAIKGDDKVYEANTEAQGVQLHKSSKVFTAFRSWADDNPIYNRVLDWKMRLDESDGIFARMTRVVTDGLGSMVGSKSDISEVLTEIARVDSSFDKDEFARFCETDIIPNVIEAINNADLKILDDWLHERAYKVLEPALKERLKMGYLMESNVLDITRVEVVTGKMMEYGPLLVISFQQYATQCLRNRDGKVIEGDPDNAVRINHVWTLCRDMEEMDARTAWQVLEIFFHEAK